MTVISLVQPNFAMSITKDRFFLPYSAATIWAYIASFNDESIKLNQLVFKRDSIKLTAQLLAKDDVVGFSTYMWNREYNLKLAESIKQINPNCVIVFGGPEMEILNPALFTMFPFIDMHVINEGEITFKQIIDNLDDWTKINNIIYNDNGRAVKTKPGPRIMDLDLLPSPHLSGVFDGIIKNNPTYKFHMTLETNRGCPYQCTFCDWGSLTYNKIRKFDIDRVFAEIEWAYAQNNIDSLDLADANFGIFVDRDQSIVDKIIYEQEKTGNKIAFNTNFAKNQNSSVFHMIKKLAERTGSTRHVTIALQSLNEEVLEAIKRKNLAVNKIKEVFKLCTQYEIYLKVELILGLPFDTLDTFKNTFFNLYDISPDLFINGYKLLGLNNSELTTTSQGGVKWAEIQNFIENKDDDITESFRWVYSTDTMTHQDIISGILFQQFQNAFHGGGFSNLLSIYSNRKGMSYKQFYDQLLDYCMKDSYIGDYFKSLDKQYKQWYKLGTGNLESIASISFGANNDMVHLLCKIHADNKYDHIFKLLKHYMKSINMYDSDLFKIQASVPIHFNKQDDYPLNFKYNDKYIKLVNLNDKENTMQTFINSIYYKREDSFAKAKIIGLDNIGNNND